MVHHLVFVHPLAFVAFDFHQTNLAILNACAISAPEVGPLPPPGDRHIIIEKARRRPDISCSFPTIAPQIVGLALHALAIAHPCQRSPPAKYRFCGMCCALQHHGHNDQSEQYLSCKVSEALGRSESLSRRKISSWSRGDISHSGLNLRYKASKTALVPI